MDYRTMQTHGSIEGMQPRKVDRSENKPATINQPRWINQARWQKASGDDGHSDKMVLLVKPLYVSCKLGQLEVMKYRACRHKSLHMDTCRPLLRGAWKRTILTACHATAEGRRLKLSLGK